MRDKIRLCVACAYKLLPVQYSTICSNYMHADSRIYIKPPSIVSGSEHRSSRSDPAPRNWDRRGGKQKSDIYDLWSDL